MLSDVLFTSDPWSDFHGLHRAFEALRANRAGLDGRHGLTTTARNLSPILTVDESDEAWSLTADVPGLTQDGLALTFEEGVLTVRGTRAAADPEGWEQVRRERVAHDFVRQVRFARPVDAEAIQARLTDGVLTVRVPKRGPEARSIPIHVA